jgi:hypothetical protein
MNILFCVTPSYCNFLGTDNDPILVLYLLSMHLWTFAVIFFHAHNLDNLQRGSSLVQLPGSQSMSIQQQVDQMQLVSASIATPSGN